MSKANPSNAGSLGPYQEPKDPADRSRPEPRFFTPDTLLGFGDQAAQALSDRTLRLIQIEQEIREAQPVKSGAVLMYLYCHKTLCAGCPHPYWRQWKHHPKGRLRRWQAHYLRRPLLALPKRPVNRRLSQLVTEALRIDKERQALAQAYWSLRRALRMTAKPGKKKAAK